MNILLIYYGGFILSTPNGCFIYIHIMGVLYYGVFIKKIFIIAPNKTFIK